MSHCQVPQPYIVPLCALGQAMQKSHAGKLGHISFMIQTAIRSDINCMSVVVTNLETELTF